VNLPVSAKRALNQPELNFFLSNVQSIRMKGNRQVVSGQGNRKARFKRQNFQPTLPFSWFKNQCATTSHSWAHP
jgi:hypothetical protein